jgi:osmotically-inducible protein OsmY
MTEWRLGDAELQADLDRGVAIVRTKDTVAGAPTGNTDDQVIETMVKGKLQADSDTAKAMIDVKAKNGEVTLKGSADSASQIGRAIALALDTQGVTKVSSEVKVNGKAKD